MSAYTVSPDTIDLIIGAANRFMADTYLDPKQADEIRRAGVEQHLMPLVGSRVSARGWDSELGDVLWSQNARSVAYRYSEPAELKPRPWKPVNHLRGSDARYAAMVLKSCACYSYQACETPDWLETFAAEIIRTVEHAAIRVITEAHDAPWGWTRDFEAEMKVGGVTA